MVNFLTLSETLYILSLCVWSLEYADCIPWRKVRPPLQIGVFWVGLKIISDGGAPILKLWGVWHHLFSAITARSTLTQSGSTCLGPIYGSNFMFKNDMYLIGLSAKKKISSKTTQKNVNMNAQWTWFPNY